MEFKYKTEGFLHDAVYYSDLRKVVLDYLQGYNDIDTLELELKETYYNQIGRGLEPYPIKFSNDGKKCNLYLRQTKLFDQKGRATSQPSAYEVFEFVRFMLDRMKQEHKQKFK